MATTVNPNIINILQLAIKKGASDIHFKAKQVPSIRIFGKIMKVSAPTLSDEDINTFFKATCPASRINPNKLLATDYSYTYGNVRFRCNCFKDSNGTCLSLRLLSIPPGSYEDLRIPAILKKMVERRSGLIIVTGPTGSGKTTSLTCLINHINATKSMHIITLEDPIEFIHTSNKCIISQREIGINTPDYSSAITEALREDPDIILVGEMRDKESIEAALRAAETGHLVLATLHTKGAANTVSRIVDVFPVEQQNQIRTQLSMSLIGVISQQLLPRADKPGRILATEVLVNNLAIQNLIRQAKIYMIGSTLDNSQADGMYSMDKSLKDLLERGFITQQDYESFQIK